MQNAVSAGRHFCYATNLFITVECCVCSPSALSAFLMKSVKSSNRHLFPTAKTKLDVGSIPQFSSSSMLGHLKVGEVAVETTEARLAPGSDQLYGGVQYNSTEPHQLYLLYMCTVGVQCCSQGCTTLFSYSDPYSLLNLIPTQNRGVHD